MTDPEGAIGTAPGTLLGVDFSCAPSARKPLTLAWGRRVGTVVQLSRVDELTSLDAFAQCLLACTDTLAGFDFPLGLPRSFVHALCEDPPEGFPPAELAALRQALATTPNLNGTAPADALIHALHAHCIDRAGFQRLIDGWGVHWHRERGAERTLPHRPTDTAIPGLNSTSPLQTRYVPVGKMYFEGMIRLVQANLTLPGLRPGRHDVLGFEAYPRLLAGEILASRSYKSDQGDTTERQQARLIARMDVVNALEQGRTRLGLRLKLTNAQRDSVVADPKGDRLDAVLCLMQAGWAHQHGAQNPRPWGLPKVIDPLEGWILTT